MVYYLLFTFTLDTYDTWLYGYTRVACANTVLYSRIPRPQALQWWLPRKALVMWARTAVILARQRPRPATRSVACRMERRRSPSSLTAAVAFAASASVSAGVRAFLSACANSARVSLHILTCVRRVAIIIKIIFYACIRTVPPQYSYKK